MKTVDILLSSFNGADYIGEQIQSIQSQTYKKWRLLVRDDGSRDRTLDVVRNFAQFDQRIILLPSDGVNLGPAKAFIELLRRVESEYFMFCDQDDVWLPQKIELTMKVLRSEESRPHLVHSDLAVVDERLSVLAPSFMKFQRFSIKQANRLERMLMQNTIVGCTVGGNRALIEASRFLTKDSPSSMVMHDWWLGLVARFFGKVTYIDQVTMLYRQHGKNTLGAKGSGIVRYLELLRSERPWDKAKRYVTLIAQQAAGLSDFYGKQLPPETNQKLKTVSELTNGAQAIRLLRCFYSGMTMHAVDRNIALFFSTFFWSKSKG